MDSSQTAAVSTDCSFPAINEQMSTDYSGSLSVMVSPAAFTVLSENLLSLTASCMFLMQGPGASHADLAVLLPQRELLKWGCSDLALAKTSLAFQQDSKM